MGKLWKHHEGTRGVNRVRVYERRKGGPLHVEWWIDGTRFQRSLKTVIGQTVTDQKQAVAIARRMAERLEAGHNRRVNEVIYGFRPNRTVSELLDRLHRDKSGKWSKQHGRDQARYRRFWTKKLGPDVVLSAVNDAMVEVIARKMADENGWSPRTHGAYLRYIVDAYTYAEKKLKWIEPRHNLSAVDIPSPKSRGVAYTRQEVPRLLEALERVGVVPGWAGHVAWQTGRRRNAVFTLPKSAVTIEDTRAVIRWPAETDKAGRQGWGVVVGRAFELTRQLMETDGAYVVGVEPPSEELRGDWLLEAERLAGIPHIKGRAWHGLKRRFANRTDGMKSRAAQAGTREDTLRRNYDPEDDLAAAEAVARRLAEDI